MWSGLMTDVLGYRHYVAQAGDRGGNVTAWMGLSRAPHLAAIHLNIPALRAPHDVSDPLSAEEVAWLKHNRTRRADLSAYSSIQATRPQALSYGLTDSPIGLAAWILEKFHD
jgi:hypothetical protein